MNIMKRNILNLAFVPIIYSCAQQPAIVPDTIDLGDIEVPTVRDSSWFSCKEASDCAVVDDMNCTFASVNKRHIAEFQLWAKYEMDQKYADRCEGKQRNNLKYQPICDAGNCSSKLK